MKKFEATFWRSNPQLANGGYETKRMLEAKTIASARKQARAIAEAVRYGSMSLVDVKLSEEV